MRFLEALNRILVGMLLSLVLLQAGLLFFMKNMEDQAQYRLVKNTSSVDVKCGENVFSEEQYWSLSEQATSQSFCEGSDCLYSHISWPRSEQEKDLQVIAVQSAPPFRWGQMEEGGVVRVRVKATEKPQVLALVSRQRLEWSFQVDKGAKIEKVIVATPQVVWLQGLPPQTVIEYLPKEKMCSYPYAWEEAFNPDNEFRILSSVLKKITSLDVTTFQGAVMGKEFRLPMFDKVRGLASLESSVAKPAEAAIIATPSLPTLTWARHEANVVPKKMIFDSQEIIFPAKTQQVQAIENQLFILRNYLLWRWDADKKDFVRMHLPQTLPYAQYMKTMTVSASQKVLFVYNDERGGEMYRYDVVSKQWSLLNAGYAYNVEALYFDEQAQSLRAVTSRGPHLTQFLKMDAKAKVQEALPLKTKISFDKKHWKWQLEKQKDLYLMRLHQAVQPQGQIVALEF
ncbi:hypothetical protein K2X05_13415 [bacterium]|nr:hypothetical protein [bacterium]